MSSTIYNSRDSFYKSPLGAVKTGEAVRFRLALPKTIPADTVRLLVCPADHWQDTVAYPMAFEQSRQQANIFTATLCWESPGLLFYRFEAAGQELRKGPDGCAVFGMSDGDMWQLTVYEKQFKTPDFLKGGVIYHIFPDRFYNSGVPKSGVPAGRNIRSDWGSMPEFRPDHNGKITNSDYFGGDLKGITQKLDYIASLGVSAIYLNPIFEAHSNHRYNTADYLKIDPLLGDEADFAALCREAKKYGIGIILDGVFSHTGSDSVYFNREGRYGEHTGAYHNPQSPYSSWYRFTRYPDQYDCWWGFHTLPNVNETDPSYLDFICGEGGVLHKWLGLGAAGIRLDVADELPDGFLDRLRQAVKQYNPEAVIIGEVWEDASNKISYGLRRRYLLGQQLDSVMNYPFREAVLHYIRYGGGSTFLSQVQSVLENYPPPVVHNLMNFLSTHDTPRAITMLSGEEFTGQNREWQAGHHYLPLPQYQEGRHLLKLAALLLYCLPGTPGIYYGDEAGLSGYRDPFNRFCYPWGYEDHELIAFFRELGALRKNPALRDGDFLPVSFTDHLCGFTRIQNGKGILLALNRSEQPIPWTPPYSLQIEPSPLLQLGGFDGHTLWPKSAIVLQVNC